MATYLDRIVASHRATAAAERRDLADLADQVRAMPPARGFSAALRRPGQVAVIAEIKRASPSKGPLAPDVDPGAIAADYQRGGASALSVLTDEKFFCGSRDDLMAARQGSELPVLRKDFTVSAHDVYDARIMGADALLIIAAALSKEELASLAHLAGSLGLDALVEVHDEEEAEQAMAAGATLIGVNQRDLETFQVDTARAERVVKVLPPSVTRVAESGIENREDVLRLRDAGFDAVLVGEALVTSPDPEAAVRALLRPAGRPG